MTKSKKEATVKTCNKQIISKATAGAKSKSKQRSKIQKVRTRIKGWAII